MFQQSEAAKNQLLFSFCFHLMHRITELSRKENLVKLGNNFMFDAETEATPKTNLFSIF